MFCLPKSVAASALLVMVLCGWLDVGRAEEACADGDEPACPTVAAETGGYRQSIDDARERLTGELYGLELSAFADGVSSYDDEGERRMQFGVFELDGSMRINRDMQGAFAFVADREQTVMTVGFIDLYTVAARAAPHGRLWAEKGNHLQIGRFDVPFGNDWQFFASKDSVSISRPLSTDRIMNGGYNDKGMRLLGNNGSVNFATYLLRGLNEGRLVGGRIGFTPLSVPFTFIRDEDASYLELGLSYLHDTDAQWHLNENSRALDMEVRHGDWAMRLEYLQRDQTPMGGDRLQGWHCTQEFMLDDSGLWKTALFARYEEAWTQATDSRDTRVALGSRLNVGNSDVLFWKLEAQRYLLATPDTQAQPGFDEWLWYTQLVLVL